MNFFALECSSQKETYNRESYCNYNEQNEKKILNFSKFYLVFCVRNNVYYYYYNYVYNTKKIINKDVLTNRTMKIQKNDKKDKNKKFQEICGKYLLPPYPLHNHNSATTSNSQVLKQPQKCHTQHINISCIQTLHQTYIRSYQLNQKIQIFLTNMQKKINPQQTCNNTLQLKKPFLIIFTFRNFKKSL
eukprot:TRINITY_DN11711_c0_g2_i1.p3 TRINITY_DN11711_c0_g2~~TRINITY_DN11711_c0_g2_i1.p3  ORF type:complete len:188 (-),score=-5.74 TRINITY_DN11711_c0_g2_i1:391-954(-)